MNAQIMKFATTTTTTTNECNSIILCFCRKCNNLSREDSRKTKNDTINERAYPPPNYDEGKKQKQNQEKQAYLPSENARDEGEINVVNKNDDNIST